MGFVKSAVFAIAALFSLASLSATNAQAAGTASGTFTLTIQGALFGIGINPASASVACNLAPGTVVANLSVVNGDGNTVVYTVTPPSGNTYNSGDLAIVNGTGANNTGTLVVGQGGFASSDCGKAAAAWTITATQN